MTRISLPPFPFVTGLAKVWFILTLVVAVLPGAAKASEGLSLNDMTEFRDDRAQIVVPVPKEWSRRDKDDKVYFFVPYGDDMSSIIIQHLDQPESEESPAVEITRLLYEGLKKSDKYEKVKIHGSTDNKGLTMYILSAENVKMDGHGKEVFLQFDCRDSVLCVNLTLDKRYTKRWDGIISHMLQGLSAYDYKESPVSGLEGDEQVARSGTDDAAEYEEDAKVRIGGIVRDRAGEPVSGVKVTVSLVTGYDPISGVELDYLYSDMDGSYSFYVEDDLPYLIHAGVNAEEFNNGKGLAGRRYVDLAQEEEAPVLNVTLKGRN